MAEKSKFTFAIRREGGVLILVDAETGEPVPYQVECTITCVAPNNGMTEVVLRLPFIPPVRDDG